MSKIKVELLNYSGSDRQIANAAWTSSHGRSAMEIKTDEQVASLIEMLARENHCVPFEHTLFTFHCVLPIAIDRQLVKHRAGVSVSSMSGRYRRMPTNYLDIPEDVVIITEKIGESADIYNNICIHANAAYTKITNDLFAAKKAGTITNDEYKRARETYRGMLPQHNMTETVVTFNLRSLGHFMGLRNKPTAQPEIQELARQMLALVQALPELEHSVKAMCNK